MYNNQPERQIEPGSTISPNPETPASPEPAQADVPTAPNLEPHRVQVRKLGLAILILVVLAVAAAAIIYSNKSQKQQTVVVKKDIPYLTYGFSDTGDITPIYPTETVDTVNTIMVDTQLFEGLVGYQDQTKVVPMLATNWYNPDNSTWVFNLHHGVKFHSGRTMTASDVKYSLDYAVAHQGDNGGASSLTLASTISQVKVLNPYRVEIKTNGPDAVLLNRLVDLYIIDSKAKLGDPSAGTGPYVVKAGTIKPNTATLDLVAFDKYWGGHVYTRAVHFQEDATSDKMTTSTSNGSLGIAGDFDAQQIAKIKAKAKYYQPIIVPDLGVEYLELNTEKTSSPLHSLAARQAAAYAMNIPAILKAGALNGTQVSQVIPSALPGHDPSIKNMPYSPSKAKQLLASVSNASAPLTLMYPSGDEGQVGEIVKELGAVGFNVKSSPVEDFGAFVNMVLAGQGDIFYLGYESNTLDGLDMINGTVAVPSDYNNPELTALINQAGSTIDPATRIATLQKIERLVSTDLPTVALYSQIRTYALTKPYVTKVDLPSVDAGVYFWQVYQR